MSQSPKLSLIDHQIMWNRLIAVVEEQANTLVFSAFSTPVREGGDLSAGIFDTRGRMLAQAVTGTPGHVNTMALAIGYFLEKFDPKEMKPGDAFITNDPWKASGHLHDFTIVTPAFIDIRVVGFFAATVHFTDIGGRGMGPDAQQVYEEGLYIPHMHLARQGKINSTLKTIILANSREPLQVEGDMVATLAAGDEGGRRLSAMMHEFALTDLTDLAEYIINTSQQATVEAIRKVPAGEYCNEMCLDGYDEPIILQARMSVGSDTVHVDFAGSSPQSRYGINVVANYTEAYSCFGMKSIIAPEIPNNHGSLEPFSTSAPESSILNPVWPAPVAARHILGHCLPDVVIGCLHKAIPDQVVAESGMMWNPYLRGEHWFDGSPRIWEMFYFQSGGTGARPTKDGLDATAFPAGIKNIPIESAEAVAPTIFWQKELRPNSGGAGKYRGGVGQIVELSSLNDVDMSFQAMFERVDNPARGRDGGNSGAAGSAKLKSGRRMRSKGNQVIPAQDRLRLLLPGGGGFGAPMERLPEAVARDVKSGLVSRTAAARDYGVAITPSGKINHEKTKVLREKARGNK